MTQEQDNEWLIDLAENFYFEMKHRLPQCEDCSRAYLAHFKNKRWEGYSSGCPECKKRALKEMEK